MPRFYTCRRWWQNGKTSNGSWDAGRENSANFAHAILIEVRTYGLTPSLTPPSRLPDRGAWTPLCHTRLAAEVPGFSGNDRRPG